MIATRTQPIVPSLYPQCRAAINADWLQRTLSRHPDFRQDPIEKISFTDIGDGIGQLSELTLAQVMTKLGRTENLVIKIQAPVPAMHQIALHFDHYISEVNFYQKLARDVPMRTPKVYVAGMDKGQSRVLIIMESFADWHSPDQIAGATEAEIITAVEALAGLTATFWNMPLQQTQPWIHTINSGPYATAADDYVKCTPESLQRFDDLWPSGTPALAERIGQRLQSVQCNIECGTQVLAHGDYRVENLFYSKSGEFAVIDWQLMNMNSPANDLAYLLASNIDVTLRRNIERDMQILFLDALRRHGVQDYSLDQLIEDYRRSLLWVSVVPMLGGAGADVTNKRSMALFDVMGGRIFQAIEDWDALELT